MIAIVDYGLGNIQAFANIYQRLGVNYLIARSPEDFSESTKIILPGVGAFDWAIARLNNSGLREALDEQVLGNKKPVLGVCVGMQMMAKNSEEGVAPGLGWIDGTVKKFNFEMVEKKLSLPHMGWNDVIPKSTEDIFTGLHSSRYYFLHSYYMHVARQEDILAISDYGISFASAVKNGNIYGTQFHPEKSHQWGLRLLENFACLP